MNNEINFTNMKGKIVIALTGPIAGGKSLALSLFEKYGAFTVSADEVNKKILTQPECYNKILERFADTPAVNKGTINRKELAAVVFKDKKQRIWLEQLLHPEILKEIYFLIKQSKQNIAVVEVPLLFERCLHKIFNLTVCLDVSKKVMLSRVGSRNWSVQEYVSRAKTQMSLKKKCALADIVIQNNGTAEELDDKIRKLMSVFSEKIND